MGNLLSLTKNPRPEGTTLYLHLKNKRNLEWGEAWLRAEGTIHLEGSEQIVHALFDVGKKRFFFNRCMLV